MKDDSNACKGPKIWCFTQAVIFVALGCCAFGIGVWLAVTSDDLHQVSVIIEKPHIFSAGYGLLIFCGLVMILFGSLGCYASWNLHTTFMIVYLVGAIVGILSLYAIAGIGFYLNGGDFLSEVEGKFASAIRTQYGVSLGVSRNKAVTDAMDHLQKSYQCCGAYGNINASESWYFYRTSSQWYTQTVTSGAPYVPGSCCVVGSGGTYTNQAVFQGNSTYTTDPSVAPINPPPHRTSNPHLNENGCAVMIKKRDLGTFGGLLGGFGIGIASSQINTITSAGVLLNAIKKTQGYCT